jgi:hypothetical protein
MAPEEGGIGTYPMVALRAYRVAAGSPFAGKRISDLKAAPGTPTQVDPRAVVSQSRDEEDSRLQVMWAGYTFAKDFREELGHASMLMVYIFRSPRVSLDVMLGAVTAYPLIALSFAGTPVWPFTSLRHDYRAIVNHDVALL